MKKMPRATRRTAATAATGLRPRKRPSPAKASDCKVKSLAPTRFMVAVRQCGGLSHWGLPVDEGSRTGVPTEREKDGPGVPLINRRGDLSDSSKVVPRSLRVTKKPAHSYLLLAVPLDTPEDALLLQKLQRFIQTARATTRTILILADRWSDEHAAVPAVNNQYDGQDAGRPHAQTFHNPPTLLHFTQLTSVSAMPSPSPRQSLALPSRRILAVRRTSLYLICLCLILLAQ
ncbi:uncharacterized protein MONBRDRAFT_10085 [Monosiga brevicollis MX1]|uniref:Uncharacterized protein n=1 Tax=Monosiga brevicollis TaxID=81824 RepID=A9V564_MONBE|nr:uncharacterized protein MONBRDRAFT_10085 [Monosiga brevicollis MX1]EDQ87220.1 predicted protein [Monosiga brevicollis MX1]|eukprot:XP_001747833.1 hypothetical protein [Monosiga brevicollis MX1]